MTVYCRYIFYLKYLYRKAANTMPRRTLDHGILGFWDQLYVEKQFEPGDCCHGRAS